MTHPPLTTGQRALAGVHVVLVVLFVVIGLVSARGSDGWADLAAVAVLVLGGVWLLGLVLAVAAARFAVPGAVVRYVLLLAGPPLALVLAVFVLRQ